MRFINFTRFVGLGIANTLKRRWRPILQFQGTYYLFAVVSVKHCRKLIILVDTGQRRYQNRRVTGLRIPYTHDGCDVLQYSSTKYSSGLAMRAHEPDRASFSRTNSIASYMAYSSCSTPVPVWTFAE